MTKSTYEMKIKKTLSSSHYYFLIHQYEEIYIFKNHIDLILDKLTFKTLIDNSLE